jgi:hypothetical protein
MSLSQRGKRRAIGRGGSFSAAPLRRRRGGSTPKSGPGSRPMMRVVEGQSRHSGASSSPD